MEDDLSDTLFFAADDRLPAGHHNSSMATWSTRPTAKYWCNSNPDGCTMMNVIGAYGLTLYADAAMVLFCLVWRQWYWVNGPVFLAASAMGIWSHLKTMLSNPGAVPPDAQPVADDADPGFCTRCAAYKPKQAYHCSKCRRCVVRMDHHCPYTNNCVGARNQKHMILFLLYCNIQAVYALAVCAWYGWESGAFADYSWLRRGLATLLACDGALTLGFTGIMMQRQILSILTGVGTIDRLKLAKGKPIAGGTPLALSAVFGDGFPLFWLFPFDPTFRDPEAVLGYRKPLLVGGVPADDAAASPEPSNKDFEHSELNNSETPLLAKK